MDLDILKSLKLCLNRVLLIERLGRVLRQYDIIDRNLEKEFLSLVGTFLSVICIPSYTRFDERDESTAIELGKRKDKMLRTFFWRG